MRSWIACSSSEPAVSGPDPLDVRSRERELVHWLKVTCGAFSEIVEVGTRRMRVPGYICLGCKGCFAQYVHDLLQGVRVKV
jgi:hypothetical protein